MTDKIKGGQADKKSPKDFDSKQLQMGIKHEMEHTNDSKIAQEIAMDHLMEDSKYYTKLKEIEKDESVPMRIEEEADGKKEIDFGAEELDKKSLNKRWEEVLSLIKGDVDNQKAFMTMAEEEPEEEEQPEVPPEEVPPEEVPPEEEQQEGEQPPEEEQQPEEGMEEEQQPEGEIPEEAEEQDPPQEEDSGQEMPTEEDEEEGDPEDLTPEEEQELIQHLKEEGYSEPEIAHILHGHSPPQVDPVDQSKIDVNQAKSDAHSSGSDIDNQLKQQEAELGSKHTQALNDVEVEHVKRMKELEYKHQEAVLELELKHKKKELEQKLSLKERAASDKRKEKKTYGVPQDNKSS